MATFKECLEFGKIYERETLKHVEYDSYEFSEGKCKEWDLKTIKDNNITYYEVKSEVNCFKYGNVLVEFTYNHQPSGINATTADYWVHYAIKDTKKKEYNLSIIPVKELKEMIKNKLYHKIVFSGNSDCYIFRMSLFDKYRSN